MGIGDHRHLPLLQAPMGFPPGFVLSSTDARVSGEFNKTAPHILSQCGLFVFECSGIIGLLRENLLGDGALASHGITGDYTARNSELR